MFGQAALHLASQSSLGAEEDWYIFLTNQSGVI